MKMKKYIIDIKESDIKIFLRVGYNCFTQLYERFDSSQDHLIINNWWESFNRCSEYLLAYLKNFNYIDEEEFITGCQKFVIETSKLEYMILSEHAFYKYVEDIHNKLEYLIIIIKEGKFEEVSNSGLED